MKKYKFSFEVDGKPYTITPDVEMESKSVALRAFNYTLKISSFIGVDQGGFVKTAAIKHFEMSEVK